MQKISVMQVMPEFGLAGAETMCESLCYELLKTGEVSLTVVSLYDFHSAITERLEKQGVDVVYLNKRSGLDIGIIKKLAKLMKERGVQVVHTHRYVMQYAIPAAILAGVKARVHTVHSVAYKEMESGRRKLSKVFYSYNKVIPVAISPKIKGTVIDEYSLPPQKIPVVFNGSDLSKCIKKTDYSASEPFRFVHIGRLINVKNQGLILDCVAKLRDENINVCVDFVGGGENEEIYKIKAAELNIQNQVNFCGLSDNVYPYLNRADAFLLPSLYEGMPVTLIEAMGTGLPIIASRVGGIPDMIEDGVEGVLIEPTVDQLASAMKRIIDDQNLRKTLGENAAQKSRNFSARIMCEGYLEVYKSALIQG